MKTFFKKNLQTTTETILFKLLKENLPNYYVAVQVSLSAIIYTKTYKSRSQFRTYYADYIICNENGEVPLLVIELDDKSHNNDKRELQDKRKNTVIQDAEIPLLRIKVGENFENVIKNEIIPILKKEKKAPTYETIDSEKIDKEPKGCLEIFGKAAIIIIILSLI
jgi:very-short-patch-repair endonuclease